MSPDEAAALAELGKASAAKRGRTDRLPYVPVILHATGGIGDGPHTEQARGLAFATRAEAVAAAQRTIDRRRATLAKRLTRPNLRSLRELHGVTS